MRENYYKYECLGRKFAIADCFHKDTPLPNDCEKLRLDCSEHSEIVLQKEADIPTLLVLGCFLIRMRGLPLYEYDFEFAGMRKSVRFFNTGTGMIGVNVGNCVNLSKKESLAIGKKEISFCAVKTPFGTRFIAISPTDEKIQDRAIMSIDERLEVPFALIADRGEFAELYSSVGAPFDIPSALAAFHKFGTKTVTNGIHTVNFIKNGEENFVFARVDT